MEEQDVQALLAQLLAGNISETDRTALANQLKKLDEQQLNALLEGAWHSFEPGESMESSHADRLLSTVLNESKQQEQITPTIPLYRRLWVRTAVAAAIILMAGAGLYTWFASSPNYQPTTTTVIQPDKTAPIANKAILTLADGTVIDLDKTGNGTIAREGKTIVNKKEDGQIEYQGSPVRTDHPGGHSPLTIDHSPAFNTLANPRGSKVIQMTLGDGSRVWLNAGSSITYPVAFLEKERKVSITGEAYFEIAHNPNKPFIVSKGNTTVQVLGTHFNLNAYDDEAALRVTLLEGSVKVGQRAADKGQRAEIVLKPGEQAELAGSNSSFTLHPSPDLEQVVAWKNGEFQFNENTDINAIMRQISRWYDVEVVYQGTVKGRFWGSIPRTSSVSQVLTLLQKTGGLNYTLEGNKVTLMP